MVRMAMASGVTAFVASVIGPIFGAIAPKKKPPEGGFSLCWQRTRFKRRGGGSHRPRAGLLGAAIKPRPRSGP